MRHSAPIISKCLRTVPIRPARRWGAALAALLALAGPLLGQSTQSVSTQPGSGIAIQVTNLYNGIPVRGFLPVRINITNSSNSDGQWDVETQAVYGNSNDRHFGAKASCAVPAKGTRMIEVLAPLPESEVNEPPRVLVHVYGPGVANSELSFSSNLQQVPRSALQVSIPLTTVGAASVRGFTSTVSRAGVSTNITVDSSGNSTRTTITTRADGSATTEVILTRPDGSTQTSTTGTDPAGIIISRSALRTTPPTRGATATPAAAPTVTRNADGSITQTTIIPQADGTTRTETKTTQANGSVSTAYTITSAAGAVIEKGGTGSPSTPPPAPVAPLPVAPPPGGAAAPPSVLPVGRVSTSNDTLLSTNSLPAPATISAGQTKTTFSTDPLTGVTVRVTVTKNADGTTTTVTSTPTKLGTDIVTVITDAAGAQKSTNHELSLSPAAMAQAVPSGGVSVPGAAPLAGSGLGDEQALLASVAAAVQPSSISIPTSAPMVFAQAATAATTANVTVPRPPPPPPPPPPPIPSTTPTSTFTPASRSGTTFTVSSGGTVYRGGRGPLYRTYSRTPGPAIFTGLSASLAHDQGEKIKNYYLTTCVRPIQQSTLDPNAMSADWRAYLGFDLIFFTSADWLAAPPEARLALAQWAAAGGELRLISKQDGGLNLPPRINEHYGAGTIEVFSDDELADYDFSNEYTDPKERALFSLAYHPPTALDANPQNLGYDVPPGMQVREFTLGSDTLIRIIGLDPFTGATSMTGSYVGASTPNPIAAAEGMLAEFFSRSGMSFNNGAAMHLNIANRRLVVIQTPSNLEQVAQTLSRYGETTVAQTVPPAKAATSASADAAKPKAEPPTFAGQIPHLGNRYLLVASVIICFGLLVGPLNLFWFCRGARRPHLLWVTPLLAVVASVAILGFILLAEGIGGRGLYYRVTQLNPDGKFAVESEIESSVTGVLLHQDFDVGELAWILDYNQAEPGPPTWAEGRFVQAGKHYSGDWFASRREQMLFARAVVPSRASLRAEVVAGKPPVLHSEYNGLMVNLFYEDADGHYWKIDRMTDGQPTHLQPATEEEFTAAWNENVTSSPAQLTEYLHKVAPVPGTFFALGSGEASALEPEFPGLRWNRFRHLITGPVL